MNGNKILAAINAAPAIVYRARGFKQTSSTLIPVLAFTAPLILGAVLHSWYNAERFGSVLEHRYQLGLRNWSVQYDSVFSIDNLFPSLYNYLMNPPPSSWACYWPSQAMQHVSRT